MVLTKDTFNIYTVCSGCQSCWAWYKVSHQYTA